MQSYTIAEQIVSGLMTLIKYQNCQISAEYGIIYAGPKSTRDVSYEDYTMLTKCYGWHVDKELDMFYHNV